VTGGGLGNGAKMTETVMRTPVTAPVRCGSVLGIDLRTMMVRITTMGGGAGTADPTSPTGVADAPPVSRIG